MSKRYFINNLDGLIGNSIIKELTKAWEEEQEPQHMGTYLDNDRLDKGKGVKKILKRYKPKLARKKMLEECDVYIYDLNSMVNDQNKLNFQDAKFVYEILNTSTPLEEPKTLILVSDIRTWSNTPKKIKENKPEKKSNEEGEEGEEGENAENEENAEKNSQQEGDDENEDGENKENEDDNEEDEDDDDLDGEDDDEDLDDEENKDGEGEDDEDEDEEARKKRKRRLRRLKRKQEKLKQQQEEEEQEEIPIEYCSYTENDYQARKPLEQYRQMKRIEDLFLKLKKKENLSVYVVCSGVLYGQGEIIFKNHFKAGWLQQPYQLPYLGEGDNLIPTIHVNDLAKLVIKVAENPPENLNYIFGIDNAQKRTQKDIIQAISNGVGSGEVQSVEQTELIDEFMKDIFQLDIDFQPSSLLVSNDPENPVEFEWTCEKGLIENTQKVLEEFWSAHNLRPMKIMMCIPEDERQLETSQFDDITKKISEHYRIPVLSIKSIIKEAAESIHDDILGDDVREEFENLEEYINNKQPRELDETMKVFYRVVKWRLNQNDCKNRGYILDNFPQITSEIEMVFMPQKAKKLERVRPKPKKWKRKRKVKPEDEQEQQQKEQQEEQNKEGEGEEGENEDGEDKENEGGENEGENEAENKEEENNNGEEGEGEEEAPKEDSDVGKNDERDYENYEYYEVEEPEPQKEEGEEGEEEEQQQEEEQEEEEVDENGNKLPPKREFFYPESFVHIKKLSGVKNEDIKQNEILDYFSLQGNEIQIFDSHNKTLYEVFESLRIYIERNKRPYNYLQPEQELVDEHKEFYNQRNLENYQKKQLTSEQEDQKKQEIKENREKICEEQIEYVKENENEIDEIKDIPFRNYLLQYVVPELNDGLVEVSNFLPDDPVEFLAEYLYKKSFEFTQQ